MKPEDRADTSKAEDASQIDRKFQGKESFLTSQVSLCVRETKPNIPDGGWGWFVVFAAFTLNAISEGVTFTFGFLYIEFLEEFQASKSATSWIGSLFMATPLIVGPLASALVDKYGCKYMTIAGGIVTAIGFIISAYARSIGIMYITFGVIGGVGRGLTYITAVVAIAFWFEKRRSLALGMAASGAGFGTIIFSPLTTTLLDVYGWRGTLLITAGCFANMCVCGMLMRDPDWIIEEEREKCEKNAAKNQANSKGGTVIKDLKGTEELQLLLKNSNSMETAGKDKFRSMVNLPTYLKGNERIPVEVLKQLSENKELYDLILAQNPKLLTSSSDKSLYSSGEGSKKHFRGRLRSKEFESPIFSKINEADELPKADKEDSLLHKEKTHRSKEKPHAHSYLKMLKHKRNSIGTRGAILNVRKYKITAASCPNIYSDLSIPLEEEDEKWYGVFLDILKDLTHFSLFLELHFFLLCCSTIILFTWFIVPYFYLAEHMIRIGYTSGQASFILSVIGFTNTVGMVGLGWIGDRLNVAKTYSVCLILCGISVLSMMYFTTNYILLVINSALFGLLFASCFSLTPSLLATLVPLDEFTMAFGLELLCEGIGNLTGPPLAGFLFDWTQSWELSFYQAGFWIIASGIFIGIIPYTKNRRMLGSGPLRNAQNNKEQNSSPSV